MPYWTIEQMLVTVPALPLAAAILTAVLGPKLLRDKSHWLVIAALVLATGTSMLLLKEIGKKASDTTRDAIGYETTITLWNWANVPDAYDGSQVLEVGSNTSEAESFNIGITLRADGLTCMMLCMVTFIATLIAIYASSYMEGDRSYWRFFAYIALFVFSMTMLVSVSNFLLLYVFWEAVGLCSYLLIGFWYEKPEAAAAGKKAFLVNRIGDFGFAIAIFLIWLVYGTLNFHDVGNLPGVLGQLRLASPETTYVGGGIGLAIALCLLLGACGKSAQFPLHVWLPDAMEGPTPVSALIHAATMVTAGVYMITRCTPLFAIDAGPYIDPQVVVACIGATTALLAGIIAMTQNDLKRVLAYSTISQLGYMFLALGTGSILGIVAGMFHLFTHAFFKALLFLGAGSVMHAMGGVIDMRKFSGLRKLMPLTFWTFLVGSLALAGMVGFAGYFSKDAIIANVYELGHGGGEHARLYEVLTYIAFGTAFLTAFYTGRALWMTFFGELQIPSEAGHHAHESPAKMTVPLVLLATCAMFVGWIFGSPSNLQSGFAGTITSAPSLAAFVPESEQHEPESAEAGTEETETTEESAEAHAHHAAHAVVSRNSIILAILGLGISAFLYLGHQQEAGFLARMPLLRILYKLSYGKFFLDAIYNVLIIIPVFAIAKLCSALDRGLVDGFVNSVGRAPAIFASRIRGMQNGLVPLYALLMALGLLALFGSALIRTW